MFLKIMELLPLRILLQRRKKICEAEFGFTFTKEDFQKWIEAADNTALMYILALMRKEGMFNCK
mgnify:CR=1 FL=1